MKRLTLIFALSLWTTVLFAAEKSDSLKNVSGDSGRAALSIATVNVLGYRELEPILRTPTAVSVYNAEDIRRNGIDSPHGITALTPNFYMPQYGSKMTSAIYVRGIGSRLNDPAVGMYIDNVPILDKSMYDIDFYDIYRIEALRGPQGSLYGRNSMGGIVNVNTPSPLDGAGTSASFSYGNANTINASVIQYISLGRKAALSVGGEVRQTDGFFTNSYDSSPADASKSGGVRARLDWRLTPRWDMTLSLSGEQSSQSGYPYGLVESNGHVAEPDYNDPAGYDRRWLVGSAGVQYNSSKLIMSSTTSYQHFDDKMQLDQDFTPANLFSITQLQHQNAVTQEFIIKATRSGKYRWLLGAFGFYKGLETDAPVTLKRDFFAGMFPVLPPPMSIGVTDDCNTTGNYVTPSWGLAVFHQSDLHFGRFTATVGLRLDYEKVSIGHDTRASLPLRVVMPPTFKPVDYNIKVGIVGDDSNDFLQFSPKVALNYDFDARSRMYASVSRGYRAGGYNIQIFSDLISSFLENMAKNSRSDVDTLARIGSTSIYYKPEYSWNYEIGGRCTALGGRLLSDIALFYIDSRNQQITQFVPSGLGRVMKNAGRSSSCGAEISLKWSSGGWIAAVNYGFTRAVFRSYSDSLKVNSQVVVVDYKGKTVPFAPRNTFNVGLEKTFCFSGGLVDRFVAGVQFTGAGKIYFTQNNDASQKFYGLLNAQVRVEHGAWSFGVWGRNITGTTYKSFYFHGMNGNSFAQTGNPAQIGATLGVQLFRKTKAVCGTSWIQEHYDGPPAK